jgi:hypothetical protein
VSKHNVFLSVALALFVPALVVIVLGTGVEDAGWWSRLLGLVLLAQFMLALAAVIFGAIARKQRGGGLAAIVVGSLTLGASLLIWLFGSGWMLLSEVSSCVGDGCM